MARGGAVTGKASPPRAVYPTVTWTCSGCGGTISISLGPVAAGRGEFKHITCGGYYRSEPGREEA